MNWRPLPPNPCSQGELAAGCLMDTGARISRPAWERSVPVFQEDQIRWAWTVCAWATCLRSCLGLELNPSVGAQGRQELTGNVVIMVLLELQAHVIGAELLELDGKADFLLWPVASDQDVGV